MIFLSREEKGLTATSKTVSYCHCQQEKNFLLQLPLGEKFLTTTATRRKVSFIKLAHTYVHTLLRLYTDSADYCDFDACCSLTKTCFLIAGFV